MTRKALWKASLFYLIATAAGVAVLMPFFWMVSTSLKDGGALLIVPVQWIPSPATLLAYKSLFSLFPFFRSLWNSGFTSVAITLVTVISSSMAAYAFAKIDFRGRETLFKVYLATMMIPGQVTIIPVFLILKQLNMINTFTGLIVPSIFNAFSVFMLRQQMKTISNDYLDAARIDGASHMKIFRSIIIPLVSPILATLLIITFMGAWNDYFWPMVILNDRNKMTLPLALSQLNGQYSTQYNVLMAGSLISMLPVIIVYVFAQKYFKSGLQLGGIKG